MCGRGLWCESCAGNWKSETRGMGREAMGLRGGDGGSGELCVAVDCAVNIVREWARGDEGGEGGKRTGGERKGEVEGNFVWEMIVALKLCGTGDPPKYPPKDTPPLPTPPRTHTTPHRPTPPPNPHIPTHLHTQTHTPPPTHTGVSL